MKPEFININEQNRTYYFSNGKVEIKKVISMNVSKSGVHRLNTEDGKKYIVNTGWLYILSLMLRSGLYNNLGRWRDSLSEDYRVSTTERLVQLQTPMQSSAVRPIN